MLIRSPNLVRLEKDSVRREVPPYERCSEVKERRVESLQAVTVIERKTQVNVDCASPVYEDTSASKCVIEKLSHTSGSIEFGETEGHHAYLDELSELEKSAEAPWCEQKMCFFGRGVNWPSSKAAVLNFSFSVGLALVIRQLRSVNELHAPLRNKVSKQDLIKLSKKFATGWRVWSTMYHMLFDERPARRKDPTRANGNWKNQLCELWLPFLNPSSPSYAPVTYYFDNSSSQPLLSLQNVEQKAFENNSRDLYPASKNCSHGLLHVGLKDATLHWSLSSSDSNLVPEMRIRRNHFANSSR